MSVRHGLLALLSSGPMHGYQLKQEFERRTGTLWPLNVGQVYTTLARAERDGMVVEGGKRDDGSALYTLTAQGAAEVEQWWASPVGRSAPARDELAIKLALAVTVPGVDVAAVVQRQRVESLRALQHYRRLDRASDPNDENALAWSLVLDSMVFAAEAEARWLDHVEARLAQVARNSSKTTGGQGKTASPAPSSAASTSNRSQS